MHCDVAIIGGGCGALWLSYELARRKRSVVLLEASPDLARYASTRGQNRLHNGALYATLYGRAYERLVDASAAGFRQLWEFSRAYAPGAISSGPGCVYI